MISDPFQALLRKEARYLLRDYRTLLVGLCLPLLIYPLIGGFIFFTWSGLKAKDLERRDSFHPPKTLRVLLGPNCTDDRLIKLLEKSKDIILVRDIHPFRQLRANKADVLLDLPKDAMEQFRQRQIVQVLAYRTLLSAADLTPLRKLVQDYKHLELRQRLGVNAYSDDFLDCISLTIKKLENGNDLDELNQNNFKSIINELGLFLGYIYLLVVVLFQAGWWFQEKEEGTLETLSSAPIQREFILVAKLLVILCFTALQITITAGVGTLYWIIGSPFLINAGVPIFGVHFHFLSFLVVLCATFVIAALLHVICGLLAAVARSFRELNAWLGFSSVILIGPSLIFLFTTSIPPITFNIPFLGLFALVKETLTFNFQWNHAFFAFTSSLIFLALTLFLTARTYANEEVIFGGIPPLRTIFQRHLLQGTFHPSLEHLILVGSMVLILTNYIAFPLQAWNLFAYFAFTQIGAFLTLPLIACAYFKINFEATFAWKPLPWKKLFSSLFLFFGLFLVQPLLFQIQEQLFPGMEKSSKSLEAVFLQFGITNSIWLSLGVIAIIPAICEEMFFRGFILSSLLSRFNSRLALILGAFIFAAIHLDPYRFFGIFLLGLLFGFMRYTSGSLLPSLVCHALNNAVAFLTLHHDQGEPSTTTACLQSFAGLLIIALTSVKLIQSKHR